MVGFVEQLLNFLKPHNRIIWASLNYWENQHLIYDDVSWMRKLYNGLERAIFFMIDKDENKKLITVSSKEF